MLNLAKRVGVDMVRVLVAAVFAGLVLICGPAAAQEVERAPVPAWVLPAPRIETSASSDDAPIRILAADEQVRIDAEGVHTYQMRRLKVQTRQGLPLVSTVSGEFSPPRERLVVHSIRIIRGDEVIDALEGQTFQTLRRENNLEASMLDGRLTATLQPRDLRVGDILETAFTIHDDGGVLAPHREYLTALIVGFPVEFYRLRLTWPADMALRAQALTPWEATRAQRVGGDFVFEIQERNLAPEHVPNNLPARFRTREIQVTDMTAWSDVADLMVPLYVQAATLEADSPLHAEIERIRAAHDTPQARAAAALRLVQDDVRYLALSMGEGGYVPMTADEVWRSRYGDCKGKTALLLALLHGLGVEAEAALVSTTTGDGMPDRLPAVGWFDHVLVRATIDGAIYWMDGARVGDRDLAGLTPPAYVWALPVRSQDADLIPIEAPPLTIPTSETLADVDATAGLDAQAAITFTMTYRGDLAVQARQQFGAIPRDQLETLMRAQADRSAGSGTLETVDTRYDEDANAFHVILTAKGPQNWITTTGGRVMALPEVAMSIPNQAKRTGLEAPYADYPYALAYPWMNRSTVRVVLPNRGEGFRLEGGDQSIEAGGFRIERSADLTDGVVTVTRTMTSLRPEITAEEMDQARKQAAGLVGAVVRLRAPADYSATAADRARLSPGEDTVETLIERAEAAQTAGDDVGARALLDAALEREPENAKALRTRAEVRLGARDREGARADYERALELDPADLEANVGEGRVALADGRYADAVVSFSVALRLDPGDLTALSGRGSAYYNLGRSDRSLVDYRALKTAAPSNDTGLYGELRALVRLSRTDEALGLIRDKLEADPDNLVALTVLNDIARRQGDFTEALQAVDHAIAETAASFNLLAERAELRARAGDDADARADFDALRGMAGGDPALMNTICWNQAITGFDLEQALADCDTAAAAGEASIIDSRAMVLLQLGRYEEARAEYDRALTGRPDLPASLYGRGLSRLALGDAGGREDVERARRLSIDISDEFSVFEARHPDLMR